MVVSRFLDKSYLEPVSWSYSDHNLPFPKDWRRAGTQQNLPFTSVKLHYREQATAVGWVAQKMLLILVAVIDSSFPLAHAHLFTGSDFIQIRPAQSQALQD